MKHEECWLKLNIKIRKCCIAQWHDEKTILSRVELWSSHTMFLNYEKKKNEAPLLINVHKWISRVPFENSRWLNFNHACCCLCLATLFTPLCLLWRIIQEVCIFGFRISTRSCGFTDGWWGLLRGRWMSGLCATYSYKILLTKPPKKTEKHV